MGRLAEINGDKMKRTEKQTGKKTMNVSKKITLKLTKTKTFSGGAIILYYEPINKPYPSFN